MGAQFPYIKLLTTIIFWTLPDGSGGDGRNISGII